MELGLDEVLTDIIKKNYFNKAYCFLLVLPRNKNVPMELQNLEETLINLTKYLFYYCYDCFYFISINFCFNK